MTQFAISQIDYFVLDFKPNSASKHGEIMVHIELQNGSKLNCYGRLKPFVTHCLVLFSKLRSARKLRPNFHADMGLRNRLRLLSLP